MKKVHRIDFNTIRLMDQFYMYCFASEEAETWTEAFDIQFHKHKLSAYLRRKVLKEGEEYLQEYLNVSIQKVLELLLRKSKEYSKVTFYRRGR